MARDNVPRAGQADARSGDPPEHVGAALKALEDPFQLVLGNPHALVLDGQDRATAISVPTHQAQPNDAAVGAVFHRVVNQIRHYARDPPPIPLPDNVRLGGFVTDLVTRAPLLLFGDRLAYERDEIDLPPVEIERP